MPAKTKTQQKEDLASAHNRDLFQSPNYATDIIVPFLQKAGITHVWECAAGRGKMTQRLSVHGFRVVATDITYEEPFNFLTDGMTFEGVAKWAIVTNPPFSLKKKFYERCFEYEIPFALLIPADYSGWIISACKLGAEKVIPTRRIDYITPNVLKRIHEGEVWEHCVSQDYPDYKSLKEFTYDKMSLWEVLSEKRYKNYYKFDTIYEVPQNLLRKYSSSDFHSMWITMGLHIGKQETFVELSNSDKDNI